VFIHCFPGSNAQDHPAGIEASEGREGLRQNRGVVSQGGGEHACAEHDPVGAGTGGCEEHHRCRGVTALVSPWLKVVADPNAVQAVLLGLDSQVD
jgi:hypothetical protein